MTNSRIKNVDALRRWVGKIPPHGDALGVPNLVGEGGRLLSGRTVAEIEAMLEALNTLAEESDVITLDDRLASPGYNWELRSTALWRLIDENHAVLREVVAADSWEFVAAFALYCIRAAVRILQQEPIGLGLSPRVAGEQAQKAVSTASWWLTRAQVERRHEDVATRQRLRDKGRQGSTSRYRKEGVAERHRRILKEADGLLARNPRLSVHDVAKRLEKLHRSEVGWSISTITNVLKARSGE